MVLDAQKIPPNTLEAVQTRMLRVNRRLQKIFTTQENLDKAIKDQLIADKNGNVTVEQFKHFVLEQCKEEMLHKKLHKKDIEGFLSAFIYNAYGATNVNQIANLVFTEENYVAKKLNNRVRANPPPPEVNGELDQYDIKEEDIHTQRVQNVLQQIEQKVFNGPVKMYQVFKQFDKDGDGYVSYADF